MDITQQLADVLSVLSHPTLQSLCLVLAADLVIIPLRSKLSRHAANADRNEYHAVILAHSMSSHITNATIIVITRYIMTEDVVPREHLPGDLVDILHTVLRNMCGQRRFISGSQGSRKYAGVVSACSGEEMRWLTDQAKKHAEKHLRS